MRVVHFECMPRFRRYVDRLWIGGGDFHLFAFEREDVAA